MKKTRNQERKEKYKLMSKKHVPGKKEVKKGQRRVEECIYLRNLKIDEVDVSFIYGVKIEPFESGVYAIKTGEKFQLYRLDGRLLSGVNDEKQLESLVNKCAEGIALKLSKEYHMKIKF